MLVVQTAAYGMVSEIGLPLKAYFLDHLLRVQNEILLNRQSSLNVAQSKMLTAPPTILNTSPAMSLFEVSSQTPKSDKV